MKASQCLRLASRLPEAKRVPIGLSGRHLRDDVPRPSVAQHGGGARAGRAPRCGELGDHAPASERAGGATGGALDLRGDRLDDTVERWLSSSGFRRAGVQAVHVREDHQQIRRDQVDHRRREAVVVSEADLFGGDRVVLVHDRNDAERQQRQQGAARVEEALAVVEPAPRHEHLGDLPSIAREPPPVELREPDLADRRGGLLLGNRAARVGPAEGAAPHRDRPRADQHHLAPRIAELGNLAGDLREDPPPERAPVREHAASDLDDDAPRVLRGLAELSHRSPSPPHRSPARWSAAARRFPPRWRRRSGPPLGLGSGAPPPARRGPRGRRSDRSC